MARPSFDKGQCRIIGTALESHQVAILLRRKDPRQSIRAHQDHYVESGTVVLGKTAFHDASYGGYCFPTKNSFPLKTSLVSVFLKVSEFHSSFCERLANTPVK